MTPSPADDDWVAPALAAVLERVGMTAEEVGPRFPLYADPDTGRWTTTARGSWTGGFWAGLLWLRARASGDLGDVAAARACTERLAAWVDRDTAARGMIFWYGTALADGTADELRDQAALACLAAFDPTSGVVPWGAAFGGPRLLVRADGVPGLAPLLARAGEAGVTAAHSHVIRHVDLCLSEDPPRPAWAGLPGGGWQGLDEPEPGWSRTAAWLLLGVADALAVPGLDESGGLREAARRMSALRLDETSDPIPPAGASGGGLDTSAAAIEAVAALKLAALARGAGRTGEADRLTARGRAVLHRLCTRHLSQPDRSRPAGMLLDGCYDAERGLATRHELIWGDYFLAQGLAILDGFPAM